MLSVGLLASGHLGELACRQLVREAELSWVLTDRRSARVIEACREQQTPCYAGNPRNSDDYLAIATGDVDILFSVNYLFIAPHKLLQLPRRYAINLHGSLLPKYRGRTPHVWAIINNEKETGVTAHLMETHCDTGGIILQRRLPIEPDDTGADLLDKFKLAYPEVLRTLLAKLESGDITWSPQDDSRATYFGKRTPEDGLIDWSWQRERIRNWIRAQAKPYPGAFFLHQEKQVHVHHSQYHDLGFDQAMPNGTVLQTNPLIVKTPNGALELSALEPDDHAFLRGDLLNSARPGHRD